MPSAGSAARERRGKRAAGESRSRKRLRPLTDTGCDMALDVKDRIFEPLFFTTEGLDKGTGLGLPAVFGIRKANAAYLHKSFSFLDLASKVREALDGKK
jgi:C4-dicarboxylate-specific signal transduction histidine kinase